MSIARLLAGESGQITRKLIVSAAIFAFVIFLVVEFGPLVWQRFDVMQSAEDLATAAAGSYRIYRSETEAVSEVTNKMHVGGFSDDEISMSKVIFLPEGTSPKTHVKVEVTKYANTLVTKHVSALKKYSKITSSKTVTIGEAKTLN